MDAQDVAVRVPKPGGLKVSGRRDAILGLELGKVVLLEAHPPTPQVLHLRPHVGDLPRRERMLRVSRAGSLVYLERGAIAAAVDHLGARQAGSRILKSERVLVETARACEVGGRNDGSYLSIRKHSFSWVAGSTLLRAKPCSSPRPSAPSLSGVNEDRFFHLGLPLGSSQVTMGAIARGSANQPPPLVMAPGVRCPARAETLRAARY